MHCPIFKNLLKSCDITEIRSSSNLHKNNVILFLFSFTFVQAEVPYIPLHTLDYFTCHTHLVCGYNVDNKNPQTKRSPLHDAVIAQDFTMVEILLSAGAKPSMRDAQNITILESAVMKGNYDMVYLLLLHGAKITNHHIHMAQKQNYQTIAQLLTYVKQYRHKLFEKTTYNKSGYPPLHQALIDQDEQRLDALLIINAPIHHKNAYGKTALELALDLKCNENIMKKLCLRDARLLI